jgi:hypothetical protein
MPQRAAQQVAVGIRPILPRNKKREAPLNLSVNKGKQANKCQPSAYEFPTPNCHWNAQCVFAEPKFEQICLVIRQLSIIKAAAVKGIHNRPDFSDGVSDSSTRIRAIPYCITEVTGKLQNDTSVDLNETEFSHSWTPSRCQCKIRFSQGQFIASRLEMQQRHDQWNFHTGQIVLQGIRRLYATTPISTLSRHKERGPTMRKWH